MYWWDELMSGLKEKDKATLKIYSRHVSNLVLHTCAKTK